ncbi:hypothetical protein [Streptomyces sp. NBC_01497]|nr:hypothetical protein [Streptomyces sp. NBC_01497]
MRRKVLAPHPVPAGHRPDCLDGRWLIAEGLALTALTVPATRSAER